MQFPCGCNVFNLLLTISHALSDSSVEFWMQRKAVPALTVFQGVHPQPLQIKVWAVQGVNFVDTNFKQIDYQEISSLGVGRLNHFKARIAQQSPR